MQTISTKNRLAIIANQLTEVYYAKHDNINDLVDLCYKYNLFDLNDYYEHSLTSEEFYSLISEGDLIKLCKELITLI